ncbi:MAG: hypothetical protein QOD07_2783 [Frankiaceae bacterium]|nr:hypothetical protein [Frankiaceae bacterium]
MSTRKLEKLIVKALASLADTSDPVRRIATVRVLQEAASTLERDVVRDARTHGVTWTEIGRVYDISKQAAQQRFR